MVSLALTAYASKSHYRRHLAPIVEELRRRGHDLEIESRVARARAPVVLVASHLDASRFTNREVIYVEHGAGQSYLDGPRAGYAGGPGLERVRLFLCPNERVAQRWRDSYPHAAVETVGSPALDRHPRRTAQVAAQTVAITSHWRCAVVPETMPALDYFRGVFPEIVRLFDVVGHAHPREAPRARRMWERLGVRFEPDPDVVLDTAGLLVADNTSLLYEAAAVDLPTLVLNAPWYRRDVEHGLRFWSYPPGLMVDEPEILARKIARALRDPHAAKRLRRRAARYAYASLDGRAASRAADAIEETL